MSEFDKIKEPEKPSDAWMLTFADLVSLIITFFVLLYSMSAIRLDQWQEVKKSLSTKLNPRLIEKVEEPVKPEKKVTKIDLNTATDLEYLRAIIYEKILSSGVLNRVEISTLDDRIVISLSDDTFASGSVEVKKESEIVIAVIADSVANIKNQVEVVGNSDPEFIQTEKYPSNWELSLSRALVISSLIEQRGYIYPINSIGRAESNYKLEKTDENQEERFRLARRVDIVIRSQSAKM